MNLDLVYFDAWRVSCLIAKHVVFASLAAFMQNKVAIWVHSAVNPCYS